MATNTVRLNRVLRAFINADAMVKWLPPRFR